VSESGSGASAEASWTARHPAATYTLGRLGLFALFLVPLMLVTGNLFVSLITAAIASSVLSIFVLRRQREALSAAIVTRNERSKRQMAERAASEDAWDNAQRQAADADDAGTGDVGAGDTGSTRD
jgi:hypothetical protein